MNSNRTIITVLIQIFPSSDLFKSLQRERVDNDDALELWNSMFFDVINNHLPLKSKRVKSSPAPWLSSEIPI